MSDATPKDTTNEVFGDPSKHLCEVCKKRTATGWFTSGNMMSAIHGDLEPRCELCMLRAQLEHAKEAAARIPGLEAKMAELEAKPPEMKFGRKEFDAIRSIEPPIPDLYDPADDDL